ncbi:MAG: 5'-deoxynucleotidase [Oscillospiraceae bacterium]|nr:5'-deoxynucleotidase [Oscillospiraceae bacterium]
MNNTFLPMLFRMRHINRWALMFSTQPESLSQHSLECAMLVHMLALIGNLEFGKQYSAERLCTYALYHDATEILTGDLPTPVKYHSPEMRETYRTLEAAAAQKLAGHLPERLRAAYLPYLTSEGLTPDETALIKSADKLCAYIKCITEKNAGNGEFSGAYTAIAKEIGKNPLPEVKYFMEHCIEAFSLSLDGLGGAL